MKAEPHYSDRTRLIVNWLRLNPGYHSVAEISDAVGVPKERTKVYLYRMMRAGWLRREYRGEYMAVRLATEFHPTNALERRRD